MGMCGGIAAGFASRSVRSSDLSPAQSNLLFNVGRLLSYTLLGFAAGFLITSLQPHLSATELLVRVMAGLMLILMGLYLSGWWPVLTKLEKLAMPLWQKIQPAIRSITKSETKYRSLALGLLWGLLPCGLVYSSLIWASASGSPASAAALMLFMGIGTLPALLGIGFAGAQLVRAPMFRRISGLMLICYGLWTIYIPLQNLLSTTSAHH